MVQRFDSVWSGNNVSRYSNKDFGDLNHEGSSGGPVCPNVPVIDSAGGKQGRRKTSKIREKNTLNF